MAKLELAQTEIGPAEGVGIDDALILGTEEAETATPAPGDDVGDPGVEGVEDTVHGADVFPPFDFEAFPSHLFWLTISFGVLYYFVNRVIMPKVGGILEDRRDRIASDLGEASRLSRETDEVIAAYESELASARQRAYAIAHERREEIKAEQARQQAETEEALAKRIAEAEAEIAKRRDAALADVDAVATDAAAAIVEKLAGVSPSRGEVEAAVSRAEAARA